MIKKIFIYLMVALLGVGPLSAQITIPNTFSPFTVISAARFNENFNALGTAALNRTNGTITGNISVNSGVTIDGVDIGALFPGGGVPYALFPGILNVNGHVWGAGGIVAGNPPVFIIGADGRIPNISSSYFVDLSLSASNLASGTVPTARLGSGAASSATFLRGDSTWATTVPSNLVAFSTTGTCPSGWTELVGARGRYIVGLPAGGTNQAGVGTPLTNGENRPVGEHTHNIEVLNSTAEGAGGAMEITTSTAGGVTGGIVSGVAGGAVAGTNAPYIQLMACEKF